MFLFVLLPVLPLLLFITLFHNVVFYLFIYFVDILFFNSFFRHFMSFYFYFLPTFIFVHFPFIFSLYYVVVHFIYAFFSFRLPSFFIVDSEIPEPIFIWIGRQHNFRIGSDVDIVVIQKGSVTNISKLSHCCLLQNDLLTELTTTALSDNTTGYEELEPDALTTLSVVLVGEHYQ